MRLLLYIFSFSLSKISIALWKMNEEKWVRLLQVRYVKKTAIERESDNRWQRGVNSLWCARERTKQKSREKKKELFGRNRQEAQLVNQEWQKTRAENQGSSEALWNAWNYKFSYIICLSCYILCKMLMNLQPGDCFWEANDAWTEQQQVLQSLAAEIDPSDLCWQFCGCHLTAPVWV